jgi:hypothetical protein
MSEPLILPTQSDGSKHYSQRTTLDGRDFNLLFQYNDRQATWRLSVLDEEGSPIASGRRIVCNINLFRFIGHNPLAPPGELYAIDTTDDDSPPGVDELGIGKRVQLLYFPLVE